MESNRFMLECASICPETTHQKLESQCLYLTLLTVNLYVTLFIDCGCLSSNFPSLPSPSLQVIQRY